MAAAAAASAGAAAISETNAGNSESAAAGSATAAANSVGALAYAFSTTTADADPGAGVFRLNHATIASATAAFVDNVDADGSTVTAILDSWDDSTSAIRGELTIRAKADATIRHVFRITGSVVDGTGYRKLTLTYVGGAGTLTNTMPCWLVFDPKGDKGDAGNMTFADDVLDEDDMVSNSASKVPTQQSVKSYADTKMAVFNVLSYGASTTAAGSVNTAAIQAAIDAAVAAGGGIVQFPAGEFKVNEDGSTTVALSMKSNVHLRGSGKYATTLKLANSQNDCHVINMAGSSGSKITGAVISDLAVDGNRANNTGSGHCIRGEWLTDVTIRDVYCHDALYYGIGLQDGTLKNVRIERVHTKNTGSEGIDVKNLEDNNENVEILFNKVEGHGQDTGFSGQAGMDVRGPCKIIGNTILDGGPASSLYGIRLREGEVASPSGLGANYSICSDNYVDLGALSGATGFAFNAIRCTGSGNIVKRGALGFVINQADVLLSDSLAQGCSGDGFTLNVSGLTTDGDYTGLTNCKALGCGGDGFQVEGDGALIIGCSARGNTGWGMNITGGAANVVLGFFGDSNTAGLFTDSGAGTSYLSMAHARALFSAASGEFVHKIRGADGKGLEVRSGHAGDDVVDLETARPVMQFLANGALAFFIGTTTRFYAGGTEVARADSNGVGVFLGALGYRTGAGGAVTQLTSKATGVTLNKAAGQITMHNASLAAAGEVSFTVTNSLVAATDTIVVSIGSGATAGAYVVMVDAVAAGSFRVSISNQSAGALGEAIVINFAVVKAVTA